MKKVIAYQCDFCPKVSKYKGNIKRHENNCWHNPKKRTCQTCAKFSITTDCLEEYRYGECGNVREIAQMWCGEKELYLRVCDCKDYKNFGES